MPLLLAQFQDLRVVIKYGSDVIERKTRVTCFGGTILLVELSKRLQGKGKHNNSVWWYQPQV
jgi:hypothetical protein